MAALRVHAAAGHADIAKNQLEHRSRVDQLNGVRMLRPSQRVENGSLAVCFTRGTNNCRRLFELRSGTTGNRCHHFRGVARVMLLHQLKDRTRMLERRVDFGEPGGIELITPARFVVGLFVFIPTGKESLNLP
jgi:hypothetical protein